MYTSLGSCLKSASLFQGCQLCSAQCARRVVISRAFFVSLLQSARDKAHPFRDKRQERGQRN